MKNELRVSTMQRRLAAQRLKRLTAPEPNNTTAKVDEPKPDEKKRTAPEVALPVVKVAPV